MRTQYGIIRSPDHSSQGYLHKGFMSYSEVLAYADAPAILQIESFLAT